MPHSDGDGFRLAAPVAVSQATRGPQFASDCYGPGSKWQLLSQVPQPLLQGICGVAWPHSLATAPLCELVRTPEPTSGAH